MSRGMPVFNFVFKTKGVTAIERSARGIVITDVTNCISLL